MRKKKILVLFLMAFLFAGCGRKNPEVAPPTLSDSQTNSTSPDTTGTTASGSNTTGTAAATGQPSGQPADQTPSVQGLKNKAQDLQSINSSLSELDENETLSAE